MAARYPSMIASLNQAIKQNKNSVVVPINSLCYNVLTKLRESGIILGFSLILSANAVKGAKMPISAKKNYPKAKIFFRALPGYIRLKVYPLTGSHFLSVRKQPFFRFRSFLTNIHGRNRYLLLTTNKGLRWDFELCHVGLGGKLLVSVVRRAC